MSDDPKTDAQQLLPTLASHCPIGVYTHRKGGRYVVYGYSIDEESLAPLVHYYSLDKKTRWTRTISAFLEEVEGQPRFWMVAEVNIEQLAAAFGDGVVITQRRT